MPTDALKKFRDTMMETANYGFDKVRQEQLELGRWLNLKKIFAIMLIISMRIRSPRSVHFLNSRPITLAINCRTRSSSRSQSR
jgi:hypothetical protein